MSGLQPGASYWFEVRLWGDGARYYREVNGRLRPGPWSASVSGATTAPAPSISLSGVPSSLVVGKSAALTITASDLDASHDYLIRVVYSGSVGPASGCPTGGGATRSVSGRTSYAETFTVYGCSAGSGTITASLHRVVGGAEQSPHIAAAVSGVVTVSPPPTMGVDISDPFAGQTVTMTASTPGAGDAVSPHQWQEWSVGRWTDLGAASTSTQHAIASAAGVRPFRVVVAYTSGAAAESAPVTIEWRPIVVTVTASPVDPAAGAMVTLTAAADAPPGVTYRWQEWSRTGGSWTDLSSTTTVQTVTSAARGTRKFRVVVSHATVPSAESLPVYVTWDEWAIVSEMVGELSAAVATSTAYRTAQTALLACMNEGREADDRYESFDDVLAEYTGDIKARMDSGGACSSQATAMFGTNQSLSRSKLAGLKSGNPEYAALLETDYGRYFEANVGDANTLKQIAYLGATTQEPGELEEPLYALAGGASGDSGAREETPAPSVIPRLGTGLGCLPEGVDGTPLSLRNKLVVLNCLIFSTPHSFWVRGDRPSREAEQLRSEIDDSNGRFAWLKRGDWSCTKAPDGPVPSCLKHDVAYGSLQKFAGQDAVAPLVDDPDGDELDEAWNPRNKALADAKFKADISKWGCQDPSNAARSTFCLMTRSAMAEWPYFSGAARINHKGWPVTSRDVRDIDTRPLFITCAEPVVPTVSGLTASRSGDTITASWDFEPGCVPVALADVRFGVEWSFIGYAELPAIASDVSSCAVNGNRLTCSYEFDWLPPGTIISEVSVYVDPRDKEYGGAHYGGAGKRGRRYTVSVGPFEF